MKTTIPAPKQAGDCRGGFGFVVCPHLVYLTDDQKEVVVHGMHRRNVARMERLKAAAKRKGATKRT